MPRYQYIAIAANGKKVKGSVTAETAYAARQQLRVRSIHPSSVAEVSSSISETKVSLASLLGRVTKTQVIDFTKQMSTLLNSGIKLTEALSVMTVQTSSAKLKNALTEIRDRVVTGESLSDALADYEFFDVIYVSMVRVGEVTGTLGGSLATIGAFMEKLQRIKARVVTAMIYPIALICFCLVAVLILTAKVIPTIGEQIQRSGQDLPWITKQLMGVGYILRSWWLLVVLAVIMALVMLIRRFFRTARGAFLRDKFLLWLPVFGPLIKQRVVARFASTLSTLLDSGLSMAESLRVVAEVTGNTLMKRAVQQARERILAGADIATPLRDSGVIDPAIAHMVAVGEKSGELETMLRSISDNLEASTDVVIDRLSAAAEPLIIIVMAVVIGVVAYATILPILQISNVGF